MLTAKLFPLRIPRFAISHRDARKEYARFLRAVLNYNHGKKEVMDQEVINNAWTRFVLRDISKSLQRAWMEQVSLKRILRYHVMICLSLRRIKGFACPLWLHRIMEK